ncbi:mannosyltransferase [Mycena crocata]|nr:mannosyltransferase [Mycena crocata]
MASVLVLSLLPLSASIFDTPLCFPSSNTGCRAEEVLSFFHPYCNAGGGGERVLCTAIAYIQRTHPDLLCIVYTGDTSATKSLILDKVQSRFSITLSPNTLHFVFLNRRVLVEDSTWPRFTLIRQSLGSVSFTIPLVRLLGIPAGAYVHYPTVSPPMIGRVRRIAKLAYYHAFMLLYALALRRARLIVVNSSWTKKHVDAVLAYPPFRRSRVVSTHGASATRGSCARRARVVLSIAQFRPEKDHAMQVRALGMLLKEHPEYAAQGIQLVLIGGCRNAEDEARVDGLRELARELGVEAHVQFVLNAPYPDMLAWLGRASVGLNTMLDEHSGINVVEFMAAGVIPIAHASGGPFEDIVVPFQGEPTGYHATSPATFAAAIHTALTLSREADLAIRQRARIESEFEAAWEASGWAKLLA